MKKSNPKIATLKMTFSHKFTFCDAIFEYRDALSLAVEAIFAAPADSQLKLDAKDETVESNISCD